MTGFMMAVLMVGQITAVNPFASAQSRPMVYGYAVALRPASEAFLSAEERLIVTQTNAERARAGMPVLAIDSVLMNSARSHCLTMAANRALYHSRAKGYAENVAAGQENSARAFYELMRSPGHKKKHTGPKVEDDRRLRLQVWQ